MIENITTLVGLAAPLIALFVALEALSISLPQTLRRLRTRFAPSNPNPTLEVSRRAFVAQEEGVVCGKRTNSPHGPSVRFMNNRPIRQAA